MIPLVRRGQAWLEPKIGEGRLTIRSTQVSSIPRSLQGEWSFERRTEAALSLMKELPLDQLATHTFPLSDAQRAFETADAGSDGLIHAALSYE